MNKNEMFLIEASNYYKHIDDKVQLYSLLHQLAIRTSKAKTSADMKNIANTISRIGTLVDSLFASWQIPESYIASGDYAELEELLSADVERVECTDVEDILAQLEDMDEDDWFSTEDEEDAVPDPEETPAEYIDYLSSTAENFAQIIVRNIKRSAVDEDEELESVLHIENLFVINECIDACDALNGLFEPLGLALMPELPDFYDNDFLYDFFFSKLLNTLDDELLKARN